MKELTKAIIMYRVDGRANKLAYRIHREIGTDMKQSYKIKDFVKTNPDRKVTELAKAIYYNN